MQPVKATIREAIEGMEKAKAILSAEENKFSNKLAQEVLTITTQNLETWLALDAAVVPIPAGMLVQMKALRAKWGNHECGDDIAKLIAELHGEE